MVKQDVALPLSPTALLQRCVHEPFVFVLDGSDARSWGTGHALLGFAPRATLRVTAGGDAIVRSGGTQQSWRGDPFALFDRFCGAWVVPAESATEPFAGGVVVALSYDLRHWVERLRGRAPQASGPPVLHAAFYDWVLSYSYLQRRYQLASCGRSPTGLQRIADQLAALAAAPVPRPPTGAPCPAGPDRCVQHYLSAVRAALEYIAAGDVYQVNLAQRFVAGNSPSPGALFAAMQRRHVAPFAAYVDGGDFVLVSNSPECFLRLDGATVATFPVKGTRRRSAEARTDRALALELQRDPKERAEHVMIVDLERNDLGRICRTGSVRVEEFARVHTFPTLHHLVSKVTGQRRSETSLADVLRATFPGGSVTGAPKIRAMEIIDELESVLRGFYTGAIGYVAMDGHAVFNLAIRTAVAEPRQLTYHAGGGIVADSVPAREYEETLLKTQPFFTALASAA